MRTDCERQAEYYGHYGIAEIKQMRRQVCLCVGFYVCVSISFAMNFLFAQKILRKSVSDSTHAALFMTAAAYAVQ